MPSNNVPNPQSYEELLGDALSSYAAKVGINDFNVGSAVTSFFEVAALMAARASGDIFQILRDFSVDRATGDALQRLAIENRVTPITAKPATGYVTVVDLSFNKISTKVYAGSPPPNIGSTTINVSDASLFPASGAIYIGRGTPNVEGPIPYVVPPVQTGNFWTITLNAATVKFHNLSESVILSQGGNRSIPVSSIPIAPAIGANPDVQYSVTTAAIILDGETTVTNVPVSAQLPGASGNVPIGGIKKFASNPSGLPNASVTNTLKFTTGADNETDDQLRVRIKRQLASTGLGSATAVKGGVIGAQSSDEQATVVSDDLIQATYGAVLFIDDGTGYEAKTAGVGLESIVDSALGGEQFFQLATGGRQAPVAKAFLISTLSAPFDLIGGDSLAIVVGGQTYQHNFLVSDFRSPGSATAYEITTSINADTLLGFEATTSGGGSFVVIRAKNEGHDSIQITTPITDGRDAAIQLGFSSSEIQTLRLYKNKIPLSKDGNTATVTSVAQQLWSPSIATGDTLALLVDGTGIITYTITDADFIATGLYTSVSATNSLASWVEVLNNKLTGVTVEAVGQQLTVTSNLLENNRAQVVVDGSSTLVTKGMFASSVGLSSQGAASDYTLSRNTAQFELAVPLLAGDNLTAGSDQTEARIQSKAISGGAITFSSDAYLWMLIDNPGQIIPTGVVTTSLLAVSKPAANTVRYTTNVSNGFNNVQVGDYIIVWTQDLIAVNRFEGRVHAVTNTTIDLLVTPAEYAAVVPVSGVLFTQGFIILRSSDSPQKFELPIGTYTLDQIATALQGQTNSIIFDVLLEEFLVMRSRTKDTSGSLLVVTADAQGQLLNFVAGSSDDSKDSLIAFYDTQEYDAEMPLFIHSTIAVGTSAHPPDSAIASFVSTLSLSGRSPNELIAFLHPYGAIRDEQPAGEYVQETTISGSTIGIFQPSINVGFGTLYPYNIRRLRGTDGGVPDRYFVASPLDFGPKDTAVVIVDNDPSSGSFEIPLFRRAITNTTLVNNSTTFDAYDLSAGPTTNFASTFGANFDFSNFKVLLQAKKTLKPTPPQTALLYRSASWGKSGENILVGYSYPSAPNSSIGSVVTVNEMVTILINLKSGAAISSAIDSSTEWNISIVSNNPSAGIDQVTYAWNGTGTAPALTLSGGEYVNIGPQTEFNSANDGIFRVSTQAGFAPTSTQFTVQRPTGVAVAESNKATLVNGSIIFYAASATTAADINTYVNSSLSQYFTTTIVNDGGSSGSGVIVLSTYENSGFTSATVQLRDGLNWLASSNLSGSPQFTLKQALTLPSDVGYAFNNGEEIRFSPTTMDQVRRFTSVLAVSGFSTVGTIGVVDRGSRLELATDTLGSNGSIQIIGGLGNEYQVPILDSATRVDNNLMSVSVNSVSGQGVQSDQWFRLQASNAQSKETLVSSNTSVTIVPDSPSVGQSTVKLLNRLLTQRYFGHPRHHVRTQGRTFRIEKQGSLVCLSWNGVGSSPVFLKSVLNFNDSGGGTVNISPVAGTNEFQAIILTGNANFTELSIGDLISIASMSAANNGTFLVTGVSDNGKTVQFLNPNGTSQFSSGTFTFNSNVTSSDSFTIGATTLVAGTDFVIGGTAAQSAANLSAVIGTLPGVTSSVNGIVVTITATSPSASIAISHTGPGTIAVSGASLSGTTFISGNFSASSQVGEGDTVIVTSPFNVLNQGKFRVIREFNDSIWFENPNVVEEEVSLPYNPIDLSFDITTSFKVNASNDTLYLNWNGVGTEPNLGAAQMGDTVTFGTDFAVANRGSFMVLRSGAKLQEVTAFTMPTGTQISSSGAGQYFNIDNAGDVNKYYVWFNVTGGSNTDPSVVGRTGLEVTILSSDTSQQVASKTQAIVTAANSGLDFTATSLNGTLTVTTVDSIETIDAANGTMPPPFSVNILQQGRRSFLEAVNPSAVNQSAVFTTSGTTGIQDHRPQLQFSEYEASVAGDLFVLTNNAFNFNNVGSWTIARVIDRDTAIITGTRAAITNISINGIESTLFVKEGVLYSGYKHVLFTAAQPGAPTRTLITFDTNAQSDKIDQAALVQMVSLNKLNYSTVIKIGLDSYRYNTGLIAEANRIIYGDPRDSETYPGIGAAGAEIFVREPLARRIQVALDIRLNTGVPFAQTAEQVRNSVSSLINSNGLGQSISISSIVSVVSAIPGILAVSVSFPDYSPTNDLITLVPGEKAFIVDPTLDISVSQIGS